MTFDLLNAGVDTVCSVIIILFIYRLVIGIVSYKKLKTKSVQLLTVDNYYILQTSRIVSAGLYYLSKNHKVQEKLRKELKRYLSKPDSPLTTEILNKLSYLKAVIKETERLAPIGIGNMRTTTKDLVLSGYRVPKGVRIQIFNCLQA